MAHATGGTHAQHGHHVTPKSTLWKVFIALVILTITTALTAQIDLGAFNLPLALFIACAKASLVVMFFMALKYDNRVNALAFAVGTSFVLVFLVFTLFDTAFRGDLSNVDAETISQMKRDEEALKQREPAPATQTVPGGSFFQDSLATPGAAPSSSTPPDGAAGGHTSGTSDGQ